MQLRKSAFRPERQYSVEAVECLQAAEQLPA